MGSFHYSLAKKFTWFLRRIRWIVLTVRPEVKVQWVWSPSQDGMYTNLKQIQDDMLLMVKNAHHFNEPGSEIYKVSFY